MKDKESVIEFVKRHGVLEKKNARGFNVKSR